MMRRLFRSHFPLDPRWGGWFPFFVLGLGLLFLSPTGPAFGITKVIYRVPSGEEGGKREGGFSPSETHQEGDSGATGTAEVGGTLRKVSGRVLADYHLESGEGLLSIQERNGRIVAIRPETIINRTEDETPFAPLTPKELAEELLAELGPSFQSYLTDHFVIIYQTSANYAVWCGRLFESLYSAFDIYQIRRGWGLGSPEFPMAAILLPDRASFTEYALREMPDPAGIAAYYNRLTNRVVLYDLSGEEATRTGYQRPTRTSRDIDLFLSRPQAEFSVMTIVHEATHQIAFNRNLFLRTGPYPLWAAEGLSMFFESPDTRSAQGWRFRGTRGKPNPLRLSDLRNMTLDSSEIFRMVVREEKFNETINESYAISWGLFYYLQNKEPEKLATYLKKTSSKAPYVVYSPDEREADFKECFGDDLDQLFRNFRRFLGTIRE